MSFAKEVIKNRKAKSLTQEMLAEQSNLSIRTIQRIESGEVNPRLSTIKLICSVLDFEYCENPKKPKKKLAYIFAAALAVILIISSLIISFDTESVSEEGSSSVETTIKTAQVTEFILKASIKELKETDFAILTQIFEGNEPDTEITIGFELEGSAFLGDSKIETFAFKEKGPASKLQSMIKTMQKALSKLEPVPEESQNSL
jgi:transcriptional regulator with XRE-family HTH domain